MPAAVIAVSGHDTGRDGGAPALPRRADAGHRQAGRHRRAPRAEGRAEPGGLFRRAALRPAARRPRWRTGSTATPPAAWCSAATARRSPISADLFKHGKVGKTYWAVVEGGPRRTKAASTLPLGRLDENRGWWMKPDPNGLPAATTWKVMGRDDGADLARAGAAHRPHASVARALRRDGLADRRRQHLRHRAAQRRARGLHLHAREVVVPLYKNRDADPRHRAGAGAHDGAAEGVRVERDEDSWRSRRYTPRARAAPQSQ